MKKTNLLIIIALILISMSSNAQQNYFCDGTVWTSNAEIIGWGYNKYYTTTWELDGTDNINGRECLKLWETMEGEYTKGRTHIADIFSEDSKIWFYKTTDTSYNKYLLYDFGLKEGDKSTITDINGDNIQYDITIKEIVTRTYGNKDFQVMRFDITSSANKLAKTSEGEWILGIGSIRGITENAYTEDKDYGEDIISIESNIVSVVSNGISVLDIRDKTSISNTPNYFQEGTVWTADCEAFPLGTPEYYTTTWELEGTDNINGQECLKLWETMEGEYTKERTHIANIFSENGKIWYYTANDNSSKKLLFDFNLRPGEKEIIKPIANGYGPYLIEVTGIETRTYGDNKFNVMCFDSYNYDESNDSYSQESKDSGEWIIGIGAITGITRNIVGGVCSDNAIKLVKVVSDGVIVFDNEAQSAVNEHNLNNTYTSREEYFTLDGIAVNKATITKGLYIRKCGSKVEKIIVR
jgi:hypothetical protein